VRGTKQIRAEEHETALMSATRKIADRQAKAGVRKPITSVGLRVRRATIENA
jgi:hypothetical protein